MSDEPGSISLQLLQLRAGDRDAIRTLWERCYTDVVRAARRKLGDASRRVSDEDDVASTAFQNFFAAVEDGRFTRLENRDDLWQVLLMLVSRSVSRQKKHATRLKRGAGEVRGESAFLKTDTRDSNVRGLDMLAARPTVAILSAMTYSCEGLLEKLPSNDLRVIAVMRLEGYTDDEIAASLVCSRSTVQRRLSEIQNAWRDDFIG